MMPNACDCHLHIIDPRFAPSGANIPPGMTLDNFTAYQKRIGTTRAVLVQPKLHGIDHACMLDALRRLGPNGRGIGVVSPGAPDNELERYDEAGIRGLRFSVWNPQDTVVTIDMIAPLAARIASLGWHAQIHMSAAQIVEHAALLRSLPCPIVFDHMGRIPAATGTAHPAFAVICDMIERGKAWLKLSGPYLNSVAPGHADLHDLARAYVRRFPERLVWGSDWPHVTETNKPSPPLLLRLLCDWVADEATCRRILIANPKTLYDFC